MRMYNKLNQLILGRTKYADSIIRDVSNVYLRSDGTVTGKLSNGDKVTCKHNCMSCWTYVN